MQKSKVIIIFIFIFIKTVIILQLPGKGIYLKSLLKRIKPPAPTSLLYYPLSIFL